MGGIGMIRQFAFGGILLVGLLIGSISHAGGSYVQIKILDIKSLDNHSYQLRIELLDNQAPYFNYPKDCPTTTLIINPQENWLDRLYYFFKGLFNNNYPQERPVNTIKLDNSIKLLQDNINQTFELSDVEAYYYKSDCQLISKDLYAYQDFRGVIQVQPTRHRHKPRNTI